MDLMEAKAQRLNEPTDVSYDYFTSHDGAKIRYMLWPKEGAKGTVIILGGRTEFIEKFYEDMYLWQARGYAVAAMDWRGQGLSHREHKDRERHFVLNFDDHIADLKCFFDQILNSQMPAPYTLMGHSAGSHNILRFLHDHGDLVERAILVAPMVKIDTGGVPVFLNTMLLKLMTAIGQDHRYVPGHTSFKEGRWGWRDQLTSDDERFEDEDYFIKHKDRGLAVGGVTYRWFSSALRSIGILNSAGYAEAIDTPILMLQAGGDTIVDNDAMIDFAKRLPQVGLVRIEGAMHEILKESDDKREMVWQAIDHFIGG